MKHTQSCVLQHIKHKLACIDLIKTLHDVVLHYCDIPCSPVFHTVREHAFLQQPNKAQDKQKKYQKQTKSASRTCNQCKKKSKT